MASRARIARTVAAVTVTGTVAALSFAAQEVEVAAGVAPGSTERVSVASDGTQAPNSIASHGGGPAVSGDGRYVAFATRAPLDPLDAANDVYFDPDIDIYLRDRMSPGHTVLISRGTAAPARVAQAPADGNSTSPAISATGRYVAFDTTATNIADVPANVTGSQTDIVICDRDPDNDGTFDEPRPDGVMDYRFVVVGRRFGPDRAPFSNTGPSISAGGRTVAWTQMDGSNEISSEVVTRLGVDDAGRLQPPPESDYLELRPPDGYESTSGGYPARVSADGEHVAFTARICEVDCQSTMAGPRLLTLNGARPEFFSRHAIFVTHLAGGRTDRMDVDPTGMPLFGDAVDAAVSGDGRVVTFTVLDDTNEIARFDVVAIDRDPDGDRTLWPVGDEPVTQTVVSRANDGGPGGGVAAALSADGRYVAFQTNATGMHGGIDTTRREEGGMIVNLQVVVRDLEVDLRREDAKLPRLPGELASPGRRRDCAPGIGDGTCAGDHDSTTPALSADGGVVAFGSTSDDLVPGDTNGAVDMFARAFRPTLQADPPRFGPVTTGSAATGTATLRHHGFGPLRVGGLTVSGPNAGDFTVLAAENCRDAVLHETGSCLVAVRFAPGANGARQASLLVDTGTGQVVVPLAGQGVPGAPPAGLHISPAELAFPGELLALSSSQPAVLTVSNLDSRPIVITGVTLVAGPHLFPQDYRIVENTCTGAPVPPGGSCRVSIVHTPRGGGDRPGALLISEGGGAHLVGLRARGVVPAARANPAVVTAGRAVEIIGTGFPANHPVVITLAGQPGTGIATSDGSGGFRAPLVVLDHATIGSVAVLATAPGTELEGIASLLVVPGTYQPPAFLGRR